MCKFMINLPVLFLRAWVAAAFCMLPSNLSAVEISDGPMSAMIPMAPPVLMLVLDNSGSMDAEMMTPEPYGVFNSAYYIFPDQAYTPQNDHVYGGGHALDLQGRRAWKTQWAQYNRVYYSPAITYAPWPSTTRYRFGPADLNRPFSNPVNGKGARRRLNLAAEYFSLGGPAETITVANAHYFYQTDGGSGKQIYLVTWEDADHDGELDLGNHMGDDRRRYYRLMDDGDGQVETGELNLVTGEQEKNTVRPVIRNAAGGFVRYATDREELQNFANWFSYHRRRGLTAKATAAGIIAGADRTHVGLYAVNGRPRMPPRPVGKAGDRSTTGGTAAENGEVLLEALYAMTFGGRTPLRHALDQVGRYCHQDVSSALGPSPFRQAAGSGCRRISAVVVTDGFGNGPAAGVGNADGAEGRPFSDAWSETLADVACHYHASDLAPGLPDEIPTTGCNDASHQHMTTSTVSFGIPASVPGEDHVDVCRFIHDAPAVTWPGPYVRNAPEMPASTHAPPSRLPDPSPATALDGLWHAAVNGHGKYFSMCATAGVDEAFPDFPAVEDDFVTASGPAVDAGMFSEDAVVYQAGYHPDDWRGDVVALADGGAGPELWRASAGLAPDVRLWDARRIVTFGGGFSSSEGSAFRYDDLSPAQKTALGSDLHPGSAAEWKARSTVEFIRGRTVEGYRARRHLLGDIVHAGPLLFGSTLFVGGNDGMLHAFDATNGLERFAYVPNLVMPHLNALTSRTYAARHRFFVDGPLYAGEVLVGRYQRKTFLVGGLGKGGKGYYCLLAGHRERADGGGEFGDYQWIHHVDRIGEGHTERDIAAHILWEYPPPRPDDDGMDNNGDGTVDEAQEIDPDMGYSFSRAFAVNSNTPAGTYRPVVIFGNGYDSGRQTAVLYVLAAGSGELIRKIDTGATEDNGLSTPALIDVNLDRRVDYAYAGDLKGNLWKFDLTSENADEWSVAYGRDADGDGVIDARRGDQPAPLFQSRGQPITSRPDVMLMNSMCATQASGYLVVFGTGQYLGAPDRYDQQRQSLYGIWDFGDDSDDSEHLGTLIDHETGRLSSGLYLQRQDMLATASDHHHFQVELNTREVKYAGIEDDLDEDGLSVNNREQDQRRNPEKYAGWYYDFPPPPEASNMGAERVVADAVIRDGKVVFTSYKPDNAPCGSGGNSRLYILAGCDGAITEDPDGEPLMPIPIEGKAADDVVILKDKAQPRRDKIITADEKGKVLTIDMVGERWGMISWRQNMSE